MAIYHITSTAGLMLVEANDHADAQAQGFYLIGHRAFPKVVGIASPDLVAKYEAIHGPVTRAAHFDAPRAAQCLKHVVPAVADAPSLIGDIGQAAA